ncbi:MAG TPA: hypothetical protein VHH36_07605 [Candidatus Thermoplasmatota archaeon]|nr:hypothetical protein [Candidatus Thermoplasmatota archaeon]
MLRAVLPAAVVLASALAGCADPLSFGSTSGDGGLFTVSPDKGEKDTVFHVSASDAVRGRNLTWQFGDGTVAYGDEADHVYGFTNGVMTITLLVAGDGPVPEVGTRTVTLGSGQNRVPTTTLTAAKRWVEVGQLSNFTARGNDADRDPMSYLWTYTLVSAAPGGGSDGHGDHAHGASAAKPGEEVVVDTNASKAGIVFDAPGKYDVKVRVRDPKGGEAVQNVSVDVSRDIPDAQLEIPFTGTLVAGTGGAGVSEKTWTLPADVPDTGADSVRHPFSIKYPATAYVILQWNDTSNASAYDLDLELRFAGNGTTIVKSERHAVNPEAPGVPVGFPLEMNYTALAPDDYIVVVRAFSGAQIQYLVTVYLTQHLTPELVAAAEQ